MLRSLTAGIVLAFAGSRANVARTILSCAGIVVGVGALIMVVTAGDLGQRYATAFSEANAGRAATMEVSAFDRVTDLDAFEEDLGRAGAIETSVLKRIENEPPLRKGDQVFRNVEVVGVDAALGDIRRINMTQGRWFTEADLESRAPVLVVNEALAAELGDFTGVQLGSDHWADVRIVGVSQSSAYDGDWYSAYLLRAPASGELLFGPSWSPEDNSATQVAYLARIDPSDSAADEMDFGQEFTERLASASWRWGVDSQDSLMAYRSDYAETTDEVIGYLSLGLIGIAVITLTTGLLGVLNVGLVTVRERRRELATYRALGASRFTLFVAVVMEAVVVAVVAGLIALALSWAMVAAGGVVIGRLMWLPPDIAMTVPPSAALVGLGSAAFVGLLAGIIPAIRALRASVVAGLRE
ncbi:ABC transporter permease [Nocardiopsis metallicus]|uniref:Putative ABC transport system permease protein n=1 Tax=Nocardiopsis metallicus TaxID=179819 RepID=A0A840WI91_9ACTN|nr:ABC transporter permease [Nocardiopsis metallicus]MBB5492721.1 putative ABC transport system permease protein [Nocardiopsis metallicus]